MEIFQDRKCNTWGGFVKFLIGRQKGLFFMDKKLNILYKVISEGKIKGGYNEGKAH